MIELTLLTIITALVVISLRHGKPIILENPLVVHRIGKYHITLAPQLNLAQAFAEKIAEQFAAPPIHGGDADAQYFSVHDEKICIGKDKFYLLAVACRDNILYLQGIFPQTLLRDSDSHLKTIQTFSVGVLSELPPPQNNTAATQVQQAVMLAATAADVKVMPLE